MVYTFKTKTASVNIESVTEDGAGYFCLIISNSGDTSPSNSLLFDRIAARDLVTLIDAAKESIHTLTEKKDGLHDA